jgi:transcriptional regulator with GAF, ATPase, and Fis domain
MVGKSPAMMKVFGTVKKVANAECSVLICGEHGTGKELVARRLHFQSSRRNHPFLGVSCGALAPNLLESELFGHQRGAFTGAYQTSQGRFERAGRGTVFLDEVADMPPGLQAKLLRALQEREFEKVGGNHTQKIAARVVAATNRDLEAAVRNELFREDLYYRLNVVNIFLPALRCRRKDIPLLTDYFLKKYGKICSRYGISVSDETMKVLEGYDWPGNVRELEHQIWRAICLCDGDVIGPEDLSLGIKGSRKDRRRVTINKEIGELSLPEAVESVERRMIYDALKKTKHVKARAARLLGITERMLAYKMGKWGIDLRT